MLLNLCNGEGFRTYAMEGAFPREIVVWYLNASQGGGGESHAGAKGHYLRVEVR